MQTVQVNQVTKNSQSRRRRLKEDQSTESKRAAGDGSGKERARGNERRRKRPTTPIVNTQNTLFGVAGPHAHPVQGRFEVSRKDNNSMCKVRVIRKSRRGQGQTTQQRCARRESARMMQLLIDCRAICDSGVDLGQQHERQAYSVARRERPRVAKHGERSHGIGWQIVQ